MSEPNVRAAIVTLVKGVSGVGRVYNREVFGNTWDVFLEPASGFGEPGADSGVHHLDGGYATRWTCDHR